MRISGGLVVTPAGVREADVVVDGTRIAAIEPHTGRGELDAAGCYVLPGGVDPHAHPLADVAAAAAAAARGGTTTIVGFTAPRAGESALAAFLRAREDVAGAAVEIVLHATIASPEAVLPGELAELARLGARGVKVYLAYPELGYLPTDRRLYELLRDAARAGLLVLVHCESSGAIDALVDEAVAAGRTDARAFARTRPPLVEEEGVGRALAYARLAHASVYLVHLTTGRSLALVRDARALGQAVGAEACAHHLLLDEGRYDGRDANGYLVVPPLRPRADVEALWEGVADGTLDTVGSDHAQEPYRPDAPPGDFRALPYGLFGIDARVPLVLSEGTRRGVPIERLADLLATAPARIFGAAPRKGAIMPGADADLVVWDPGPVGLRPGGPPFGGLEVRGAIRRVLVGGAEVG